MPKKIWTIKDNDTGLEVRIRSDIKPNDSQIDQAFQKAKVEKNIKSGMLMGIPTALEASKHLADPSDREQPEGTPFYKQLDPKGRHGILALAQDVGGQYGSATINRVLGDAPRRALDQKGMTIPAPATKLGEAAEIAGKFSGEAILASIPMKIPFLEKARHLTKIPGVTEMGIGGILTGITRAPKDEFGQPLDASKRIQQAAIEGGIAVGAGILINTVPKVFRAVKNAKNEGQIVKKVRNMFVNAKRAKGKAVGEAIERAVDMNSNPILDISDEIKGIKDTMVKEDVRSLIRRVKDPVVRKQFEVYLQNPDLAKNARIDMVQELKKSFDKFPGMRSRLAKEAGTVTDYNLSDIIDDIAVKQKNSYKELEGAFDDYAHTIKNYNLIKRATKEGGTKSFIMGDKWDDPDVIDAVNDLLPRDTIKEIGGYRTAAKTLKNLGQKGIEYVLWFTTLSTMYSLGNSLRKDVQESGGGGMD